MIEVGKTVSIEYTLTLSDGSVADSSEGREPLRYEHGGDQILPALESALAGLQVNDTRSVTLSPEEGYGVLDPELIEEVPVSIVPEDARTEGAQLVSEDTSGNRRVVRVKEVREDTVLMDLNHPLAGETLHFEVMIVGID